VRRVRIAGDAAALEVTEVDGVDVRIDGDHDASNDDDVLVITPRQGACSASASGNRIVVQVATNPEPLRVGLPAAADVEIDLRAGSVTLHGLSGQVDVRLEAGSVIGDDLAPTGARLRCDVGTILVRLRAGTDRARVDAAVGVGRASVT
jgi:hypothetical protein